MDEKKVKSGKKAKKEEKIGEALLKVALGYQIAEVTEEYAEVDGALKLTKRKKTKKDVPPDLKAVQLLLSSGENGDYGQWTDEALEAEKKRLLAELQDKLAESKSGKKAAGRSVDKVVNEPTKDVVLDGEVCGENTENSEILHGGGIENPDSGGRTARAEQSVSEASTIKKKTVKRTVKKSATKKKAVKKAAK